jgi:hypothetical protein
MYEKITNYRKLRGGAVGYSAASRLPAAWVQTRRPSPSALSILVAVGNKG